MLRAISASQGCRVSSKGWFRLRRHWNWKAVLAIAQQGKFVPELPPASLGQAPFLRCFNQGPTLQFWLDLIQAEFLFLFSVVLALLNQVQGISFSWNAYRVFLKVSVFVSAKKKKENQNKKKRNFRVFYSFTQYRWTYHWWGQQFMLSRHSTLWYFQRK